MTATPAWPDQRYVEMLNEEGNGREFSNNTCLRRRKVAPDMPAYVGSRVVRRRTALSSEHAAKILSRRWWFAVWRVRLPGTRVVWRPRRSVPAPFGARTVSSLRRLPA